MMIAQCFDQGKWNMSQLGFFDIANHYAGLDAKNYPLLKIDSVVTWEEFRHHLEAVWRKSANPPSSEKSAITGS